jgi:hypothetical protein
MPAMPGSIANAKNMPAGMSGEGSRYGAQAAVAPELESSVGCVLLTILCVYGPLPCGSVYVLLCWSRAQ